MKCRLHVILFFFLSCFSLSSVGAPQSPSHNQSAGTPQRTPEEIARKQTEMLVRDLEIKDSLQIDTIYCIHLRYARLRQMSNTRAEHLARVQQMYAELKEVLTEEQYTRFMNQQLDSPRRPQTICKMPQPPHSAHPHAPRDGAPSHK
ncbi:MAG: hypothetical protein SPD96_07480 [Paludibacteraceae bacterium]|nr:hypothetical protein [Paludibacteraceae bacterium]